MYFSLPVERKVPKERHAREAPRCLPYGTHHLRARDPFAHAGAKRSDCAEGRGQQRARTNGGAPSALNSLETRRRKRKPIESSPRTGKTRELGAPPRLRTSIDP